MAEQAHPDDLAQEARLVFRGTVQRVKASLMAEVPASEQTCVVRIDEVLQSARIPQRGPYSPGRAHWEPDLRRGSGGPRSSHRPSGGAEQRDV